MPPYDRFITGKQPAVSAGSCGPSSLTASSMLVTPSKTSPEGFTYRTPQPAAILEGERTTTAAHDAPGKVVLLSGLPGSSVYAGTPTSKGVRYVLGPGEMTSHAIASATATQTKGGMWLIEWTTTSQGGPRSGTRRPEAGFHRLLAVDVGLAWW